MEQIALNSLILRDALSQLVKNHAKAEKMRAEGNQDDFASFRTAAIKNFELTFEVSLKLIKRYFEWAAAIPDEIDGVNYRTFLRIAAEIGLIDDPLEWGSFRQERNKAVHAYMEKVAEEIYERIPVYIAAFTALAEAFERHAP